MVKIGRVAVCALLFAMLQVACTSVTPTQRYRIVDLGVLTCTGNSASNPACYVGRVNNWCQVAGWDVLAGGEQRAFVWRPGPTESTPIRIDLDFPALSYDPTWDRLATPQPSPFKAVQGPRSTGLRAHDINNFGEVIGFGAGPRNEAILWVTRPTLNAAPTSRTARTAYLGELPLGGAISFAFSMNDEGQIAGSSAAAGGRHAIYFSIYDGIKDLGDLPHTGPDTAEAFGVGEGGGHIVGVGTAGGANHAFYWNIATPTVPLRDLGDLPAGADSSRANAVSRWGVVVGEGGVPNGSHAFRWEQSSGMQDLGDLAGGLEASAAFAIMDTVRPNSGAPPPPGDIVGFGTTAAGKRAVGWQASAAGAMSAPIDLNTLVDPNDPLKASAVLEEARGINKFGVISAIGKIMSTAHVFLLVPADVDNTTGTSGMTPFQEFCVGPFTQ